MNTRFDYEYIRENNNPEWKMRWYGLLDGRFVIENNQLIEDENAPIFRLGFSVAEVESALGYTGYTNREREWYQSQPDRYVLVDDAYIEVDGWGDFHARKIILEALDRKLTEIDLAVEIESRKPFVFGKATFYMEVEYIQGLYSAAPLLPNDWEIEWKTADKPDGVNNIYITLKKSDMAALAMAALQRKNTVWHAGDALKKQVKALASAEEIEAFVVAL